MEFRVLGPLEVSDNGQPVDLGGPTQRSLLAILVDRLVDELWGEEPPATAVQTLQAHVSRLRGALNGTGEDRVETRGHGYLLPRRLNGPPPAGRGRTHLRSQLGVIRVPGVREVR